ncbi:acyloxyacyl hydrolase [Flavobacterium sp.]|uniref:acyloxyacyl hydrolase n=1 Tax=Flavobacterium sp. TaxID=239 RepID=UPI0039E664AE
MKTFVCGLLLMFFGVLSAQDTTEYPAIDINYLRSNVLLHSPELAHLITGHPEGFLASVSIKTNGSQEWEAVYNYPDYGGYFLFQDFRNPMLGKAYAVGGHYNFYFLQRQLSVKIGQGVAMVTNPYDKVTNPKNTAFGSKFMANTALVINYRKENLIDNFGFQAGLTFTHFSVGRMKSPNTGINTIGLNLGINYNFREVQYRKIDTTLAKVKFVEPIKYNMVFRGGVNESPVIGSGQKPFYHISAYADKRIGRKSAFQLGAELFLTTSDKDYIEYRAISYPEEPIDPDTDYKRIGLFIGHELFINRISIEAQVGYYIYDPAELDIEVYDRVGMKYYVSKKIFAALSVKTHGFMAEALEFGLGVRL